MGVLDFLGRKKGGAAFAPSEEAFSEEGLKRIADSVEEAEIPSDLPDIHGQMSLEVAPMLNSLARHLASHGARKVAALAGRRDTPAGAPAEANLILSHWDHFPFVDASWDFLLLRFSLWKGDLAPLVQEANRILKPGGRVYWTGLHPYCRLKSRRLSSSSWDEAHRHGLERQVKIFHEAGWSVQFLREIFFESSLKRLAQSEHDRKRLDELKKEPFLIFYLLKKE